MPDDETQKALLLLTLNDCQRCADIGDHGVPPVRIVRYNAHTQHEFVCPVCERCWLRDHVQPWSKAVCIFNLHST
jgi:hypothetical protein